jgi:hypothetical protein
MDVLPKEKEERLDQAQSGYLLNSRISQYHTSSPMMKHRRRRLSQLPGADTSIRIRVLELPGLFPAVMSEPRVVVSFVEILEDAGEDLGLFVWEVDALSRWLEGWSWAWRCWAGCLGCAVGCEEGGCAEDGFVGGEEAFFRAHAEHYYWAA